MRVLGILCLSAFLIVQNPVSQLKTNRIPTQEEASLLNQSMEEYNTFINAQGQVCYRDYDYRRVKGDSLPFVIDRSGENEFYFAGRHVNLKVGDG